MTRKELKKKIEWNRCTNGALTNAIDFICPFDWHELRSGNRKTHLKNWRAAVMVAYYINGDSMVKAASYVDKDHSTLVHQIKNVEAELFTCQYNVIDKVRLINYYCVKAQRKYCIPTKLEIKRA